VLLDVPEEPELFEFPELTDVSPDDVVEFPAFDPFPDDVEEPPEA